MTAQRAVTLFTLNCVIVIYGSALQELNLLILVPKPTLDPLLPLFYQPSYAEGPALVLAAELAVEMANRNSSILSGYHLNLLQKDSGCSVPFKAVEAFAEGLLRSVYGKTSPIVGVVGPACSLSALAVGAVSGRSDIALINVHLAGTHVLQNRTQYPYSFGLIDSSDLIGRALVSLTQLAGWTDKVALFYDTSRQYSLSVSQMIGKHEAVDVTSDFLEPVGIGLEELSPVIYATDKFRVIFLVVGSELLSRIMCIAYSKDFTYPTYQYVIDMDVPESVHSVHFAAGSETYNCSQSQVKEALNGSIFVALQVERLDVEAITSSGISLRAFEELYSNRTSSENIEPSLYGAAWYDAVWALVLALDGATATTDLGSYRFGHQNVTDMIAENLVSTSFEGLSGNVSFNDTTGHVDQNAQFFVMNADDVTQFMHYSKEGDVLVYNQSLVAENFFIDNCFDEVILTLPQPLTYFILVLLLFGFLLTLALNVATCVYRRAASVKASSVKLSQVTFIGCYVLALSLLFTILMYGFTDKIHRSAVCKLQHLLDISMSVGLTLLLGAVCVRLWRLHRIFNHFQNPGVLLSDHYLILIISILVFIDLAINVPVFFVEEYQPTTVEIGRRESTITKKLTCTSTYFYLYFAFSFLLGSVLLGVISVLAILTRKIPIRNFKTRSVMYLSYMLAAVVPFSIGTYLISASLNHMVLRCCVLCFLLLFLILIPCVMLFLPPLLPIFKKRLLKHIISF
jgi:hypothetical protein